MGGFRDTVLSMCWLIPALAGYYIWVVSVSNVTSPHSVSPSPAPTKCSPEAIRDTMSAWVRWMTTLVIASVSILYYVRKVVESAAAEEAKGNILEDEIYKAAQEELKEAVKAVEAALAAQPTSAASLDDYVIVVGKRNVATTKATCAKPKEGMARLPRGMQIRVRFFFLLALFLSFVGAVCAAVAFYLSLRLQIGCVNGVAEVGPFVLCGLISLAVHLHGALAAFRED